MSPWNCVLNTISKDWHFLKHRFLWRVPSASRNIINLSARLSDDIRRAGESVGSLSYPLNTMYTYIYTKRPFGSDEIDFHSYAACAGNVWKMTIKTNARVSKTTCAFDKITFSIRALPRKWFSVYCTSRTANRKYTNYRRVRTLAKTVVFLVVFMTWRRHVLRTEYF